ncbi:diguanylate cyclase [Roseateles sp.]|uniref:diguanylate cyclase n=1 Tax=Roseateles sp. TaxID=1971397 RepID=UPI0031E4418A
MHDQPAQWILMVFVIPVWLLAGVADWICHRAADIGHTAGAKESLIHLLMFAEVGVPVLAGLFLEINALVLAVMLIAFLAHEATALWDVRYASSRRVVGPIEQHVHSFLELVPLMAIVLAAVAHWPQCLALFGGGNEAADWSLRRKEPPLPASYLLAVLASITLLEIVPFVEELLRGWREGGRKLVPRPQHDHAAGSNLRRPRPDRRDPAALSPAPTPRPRARPPPAPRR